MQFITELPSRVEQLEFNRQRWREVLSDRRLTDLPYRIETNAHGQILMSPPASGNHSHRQGEITFRLRLQLGGHTLPECPISTIDGVKAADVGWYSVERFATVQGQDAFETAPEICVEILSPSNTVTEMVTKRRLYFDAGTHEVWFCSLAGMMTFHHSENPELPQSQSNLCPSFPRSI